MRGNTVRLLVLGACTTAFQALFSREFLAIFSGNEVVLAAVFGPWLALTAAGALMGRMRQLSTSLLPAYGVATWVILLATRLVPRTFDAGAPPGPAAALAWAALLLAIPCVLSGALFSSLAARHGRAYLVESLGAAAAGALLSLVVLGHVGTFEIAGGIVMSACAGSVWPTGVDAGATRTRAVLIVIVVIAAPLAIVSFTVPVGQWALRQQSPHLTTAVEHPSARGSIVVTNQDGEWTVFENGTPLLQRVDVEGAEEAIHVPLAIHPAPVDVLVVGAPPSGAIPLVRAHGVRHTTILLDDEDLSALLLRLLPEWTAPDVTVAYGNLRGRPAASFDAVLLFNPEPTTALHNRLVTREFFHDVSHVRRPGALVALFMPGHDELTTTEQRRLHSSVARTMESSLGATRALPAARTIYIAAPVWPADLAKAITAALTARGIQTS